MCFLWEELPAGWVSTRMAPRGCCSPTGGSFGLHIRLLHHTPSGSKLALANFFASQATNPQMLRHPVADNGDWLLDKINELPSAERPMSCLQQEGDAVFIPDGW